MYSVRDGQAGFPRATDVASLSGSMPRAKIVSRCSSTPFHPSAFLINVFTENAGMCPS